MTYFRGIMWIRSAAMRFTVEDKIKLKVCNTARSWDYVIV